MIIKTKQWNPWLRRIKQKIFLSSQKTQPKLEALSNGTTR